MPQGVNLNFVSWNCRGLQQLRKVKQVMNKIKDIDSKNLLDEDNKKIRRRWQGSVFTASFSSRARGVMTLIHKTV